MATITLKNVPDTLYQRVKESAERHRRSINSELIVMIEDAVGVRRQSTGDVLQAARSLRRRMPGAPLSVSELDEAKRRGRP